MKKRLCRKCLHCGELYLPDPRTRKRQCYCSAQACRKASKAASQRRWAAKPENQNYHCGPAAVDRTRRWRAAHPGYWRRKPSVPADALQDECPSHPADVQQDNPVSVFAALQDDSSSQFAILLGLTSLFTGDTLQDDIAETIRRVQDRGRTLLGIVPGGNLQENSS
jgi:hypothetical protein